MRTLNARKWHIEVANVRAGGPEGCGTVRTCPLGGNPGARGSLRFYLLRIAPATSFPRRRESTVVPTHNGSPPSRGRRFGRVGRGPMAPRPTQGGHRLPGAWISYSKGGLEARAAQYIKNSGNEAKKWLKTKDITFLMCANDARFARQLAPVAR